MKHQPIPVADPEQTPLHNQLMPDHSRIAGNWFTQSKTARFRLTANNTWHEVTCSRSLNHRGGTRSVLHGTYTFDGQTLTMITTAKTCIRWQGGQAIKERTILDYHVSTESPVLALNEHTLTLGDYKRTIGNDVTQVSLITVYHRGKRPTH